MVLESAFIPRTVIKRGPGFGQNPKQFLAHFFAVGFIRLGLWRIAKIKTKLFRSEFEEIVRLIRHICIQPVAALAVLVPHQT